MESDADGMCRYTVNKLRYFCQPLADPAMVQFQRPRLPISLLNNGLLQYTLHSAASGRALTTGIVSKIIEHAEARVHLFQTLRLRNWIGY